MLSRPIALVIDDDDFFASILSEMLLQRKFQPLWCSRAEDALEHFQRGAVELLLCDIFMPGIGGIKAIEAVKQIFPKTVVFAMSGGAEGMGKDKALLAASKIGADAVLMKPFSAEVLDGLLEHHGFELEQKEDRKGLRTGRCYDG